MHQYMVSLLLFYKHNDYGAEISTVGGQVHEYLSVTFCLAELFFIGKVR